MTTLLIHPRCLHCESTPCRRVRSDEPCPTCGRCRWQEKHEPAFQVIEQRPGGWYGVQNWQMIETGDAIDLLVGSEWLEARATKVVEGGFYAVLASPEAKIDRRLAQTDPSCGGLPLHRVAHADENHRWRLQDNRHREPRDITPTWIGPFLSREAAETVRYDHAPGYLVCGVCGEDALGDALPAHYREHHAGGQT